MKHEVPWNKEIIENFIKYGNLSQEEIKMMQLRTKNFIEYEICSELSISPATYYRKVEKLRRLYDKVVYEHPELDMPKRSKLNSKLFAFDKKENALEFINNLTFEEGIVVEMKIIKTKKGR